MYGSYIYLQKLSAEGIYYVYIKTKCSFYHELPKIRIYHNHKNHIFSKFILKCERYMESWIPPIFFDWLLIYIPGLLPLKVAKFYLYVQVQKKLLREGDFILFHWFFFFFFFFFYIFLILVVLFSNADSIWVIWPAFKYIYMHFIN